MLYFILCAVVQGVFKSCSDALMSGKWQARFGVRNPQGFWGSDSWVRKWKDGDSAKGERFWGSSHIFVWTTDAWHLSNALGMIASVVSLAIAFTQHVSWLHAVGYVVVYWVLRSGTHHVLFTYFFTKKRPTVLSILK